MSRATVLLHVGYIKTATTYLQQVVFSGKYGDLELAAGRETRAHLVENIILSDDYCFDADQIRDRMERLSASVRRRGKTPVWSEEMLLGNPPTSRYDGFSNARKLQAVFPEAQVVITIRRQQSLALSMYREFILGGGRVGINEFVGQGIEPLSFSPVLRERFLLFDLAIKHYRSLFGEDRVLVLPQELLARDSKAYLSTLSDFARVKVSSEISEMRRHIGEGMSAVALRRSLNRFIVQDPTRPGRRGLDACLDRVVRGYNRIAPKCLDASLQRRYSRVIESRYCGVFGASNRGTANMTGCSLDRFGYDL